MWGPRVQIWLLIGPRSSKISEVPDSICREVKELKAFATQKQDIRIDLDGELSGTLPAHFSIVPKALTLRGLWK